MFHFIANRLLHQMLISIIVPPILCCLMTTPLHADEQQGLLFRFHKPGGEIHYLFGTMHVADPRIVGMLEQIKGPLADSQQLVMEMVPDVTAMISSSIGMMLPAGQTLQQLLGKELYEKVLAAVADMGLTDPVLQRFKPWAVAVTLSLPSMDGAVLDQLLYQLALENEKPVFGLESATEQLAVFDTLSQPLQIMMLRETVHQMPQIPAMFEAMVNAYVARDLIRLQQLTLEYELSSSDKALTDWLRQELIVKRNIRMAKRLTALLDKGSTFVAIGALHLVDDSGLIQALKQAGYSVESIY